MAANTMSQTDYSKDLVDALKAIVFDCNWQCVGNVDSFAKSKCYRLVRCSGFCAWLIFLDNSQPAFLFKGCIISMKSAKTSCS